MPIETIVIVGGGVAGWLAALALARKTTYAITLINTGGDGDSLGLPMAVEATLPSIAELHAALGLDEDALISRTGSSYTLGRALSNWTPSPNASFHPYGEIGASLGPIGFQHLVARMRAEGNAVNFANYSVAALCAQSGRFARPPADDRSVLSTMTYGLHLNMAEYCDFLKRAAITQGVVLLHGKPAGVLLDDQGLIVALDLDDGETVAGDLFLDCSGQSRTVAGEMPDFAFEDWSHWLPCNQCKSSSEPANASPPAYTHVDAHARGWQGFAASQTIQGDLLVYEGVGVDDAYAYTAGRIAKPWSGNCVAIGGSAAIIDPLTSTQLHLAGSAIQRLLKLLPHHRTSRIEAAEYNRQTIEELENARDFAVLHYKCNQRRGEAFWDSCRTMDVPDRLAHKIMLYESCGRIALHDEESFEAWDWIAAFDALNVCPRSYDAMADGIPKDRIEAHMNQVRNVMLKAVASLPAQHDYLQTLNPREAFVA